MNRFALTALAATVAVAAVAPANAAAIFSVANTGTPGAYTVNGVTASVVTNPVWSPNTAKSSWISVNPEGLGSPDTSFTYTTSFTVTGAAAGDTASILNVLLAADDAISEIRLFKQTSGPSTQVYAGSAASTYPNLTPYALNLGVLTNGTYSLSFIVYNQQPGGTLNPTGFRLENAVPEPATWGMMIVGFGLMGGVLRRRSTKVAFA